MSSMLHSLLLVPRPRLACDTCPDCMCACQVSAPYELAEFDIMYGDGINALGCVFDVAKELDVLEGRVSTVHLAAASSYA